MHHVRELATVRTVSSPHETTHSRDDVGRLVRPHTAAQLLLSGIYSAVEPRAPQLIIQLLRIICHKARAEEAIAFLYHRIQANKGGNLIINTHYPTDYFYRISFGVEVEDVGWVDAIDLFKTQVNCTRMMVVMVHV